MFTATCDNNSLLSVVGLSTHLVLPPTVCGCPWFGQPCCSRISSGEKTCLKGSRWELGSIFLFPECPSKAGGCGRAYEVPSLTACWGKGSGRWEHPFIWITAGIANLPHPQREQQADLELNKGKAEEFSVFTCTHLNGSRRPLVRLPSFVPKWS